MKSSRFLIAICLAAIPATSCGSVEADAEGGVDSETLADVAVVDTANDDTQDASVETAIDSADVRGDTCDLDYDDARPARRAYAINMAPQRIVKDGAPFTLPKSWFDDPTFPAVVDELYRAIIHTFSVSTTLPPDGETCLTDKTC